MSEKGKTYDTKQTGEGRLSGWVEEMRGEDRVDMQGKLNKGSCFFLERPEETG